MPEVTIDQIAEPNPERVKFILESTQSIHGLWIDSERMSSIIIEIVKLSDFWTSKHPTVPSSERVMSLSWKDGNSTDWRLVQRCIAEWQRRMYLKPKPVLPADVRAIMEDYGFELSHNQNSKVEEMVGKIVALLLQAGAPQPMNGPKEGGRCE
jgi:hypothetical protein